jgi:hypothetical protein
MIISTIEQLKLVEGKPLKMIIVMHGINSACQRASKNGYDWFVSKITDCNYTLDCPSEGIHYTSESNIGGEYYYFIDHSAIEYSNKGKKRCEYCNVPTLLKRDFNDFSIREFCPRCKK